MRPAVAVKAAVLILLLLFIFPTVLKASEDGGTEKFPSFTEEKLAFRPLSINGGRTGELLEIVINRWGEVDPDAQEQDQTFTVSVAEQPSFMKNVEFEGGPNLVFLPDEDKKTVELRFDTIGVDQLTPEKQEEKLVILIRPDDPDMIPAERLLVIPFTIPARPSDLVLVRVKKGTEDLVAMGQRFSGDQTLEKDDVLNGTEMGWVVQSSIDAPPGIRLGEDFSIGLCVGAGLRNRGRKTLEAWPEGTSIGPELEFASQVAANTDFVAGSVADSTMTAAANTFTQVNLPMERGGEINPVQQALITFRYDPEQSDPPHLYHYEAEANGGGEHKPPKDQVGEPGPTWNGGSLDIETDIIGTATRVERESAADEIQEDQETQSGENRSTILGQDDTGPAPDPNNAVIVRLSTSIRFSDKQYKFAKREWELTYRQPLKDDEPVTLPPPAYASGGSCGPALVEGEDLDPFNVPVLKLVEVIGPDQSLRGYQRAANELGYTWRQDSETGKTETRSLSLQAPQTIRPDEPFSFSAEVVEGIIYGQGDCINHPEWDEGPRQYLNMSTSLATGLMSMSNNGNVLRARGADLGSYCPGLSSREKETYPSSTKRGSMSMTFRFRPTRQETEHGHRRYYFSATNTISGESEILEEEGFGDAEVVYFFGKRTDDDGNLASADDIIMSQDGKRSHNDHIRLSVTPRGIGTIELIYMPVLAGEAAIAAVPHQHPPGLTGPDSPDGGGPPGGGDTRIAQDGNGEDGSGTENTETDPDSLDPNTPEVGFHIHQWLAEAEPPENAVPGANWHYDEYGRMVGTGAGLRTIQERTHDSVDYSVGTPDETVWSLRKKLDSIDHCNLEEYVVARLSQQSIEQCRGRYGAVHDLKGVGLSEAKNTVASKGFTYVLAPGSPAGSEGESGTVEKQEPGPKQYLKKGAEITLYIHAPYVPRTPELPDFTGRSLTEAKKWLTENGLKMELEPGTPASSRDLSGTVEKQYPATGTQMAPGGSVTLTVHSDFIDVRQVPDVSGLTFEDARRRLENAGLATQRQDGGRPPDSSLAYTAANQKPEPGTRVAPGQAVQVWFYGDYIPSRDELVAAYDCRNIPGSRAYWDDTDNAPRCGCFDDLWLNLSRTQCVPRNVVDNEICSRDYPGSVPTGHAPDGSVNCDCPAGLKWNSANTQCIDERIVNNELCARDLPGSVANGYLSDGRINCECPPGLKWNSNNSQCIDERIVNSELCARDFPGSVANGYQNDGRINCECPSGLVWNANGSACVQPSQQNNNQNNQIAQDCSYKIWQIGLFVQTYNMDRRNNGLQKQMAQNLAREASGMGCDQAAIASAMSGLGGGGTGRDNGCPPGTVPGTRIGSLGQEEACVPAGTTGYKPTFQCPPTITLLGRTRQGSPPRGSVHHLVKDRSGFRSSHPNNTNTINYYECRYDVGGYGYDAIRMTWVEQLDPADSNRLRVMREQNCNRENRLPPNKMDGWGGRTGEVYGNNKMAHLMLDWEYTDRDYLINLGVSFLRQVEPYAMPCSQ